MKKLIFTTILLIFALNGCSIDVVDDFINKKTRIPVDPSVFALEAENNQEIDEDTTAQTDESKPIDQEEEIDLPSTFNTDVAFVSQAPTKDWELPYQEACEEASLIIVDKYFNNENLDEQIMQNEILALVEWEIQKLGTYTDTNLEEVAYIIENYFDLNYEIIENVNEQVIKEQLVKGRLLVAPFAGRMLENKYFTEPGPLYHMLVIKGYDRNEFITNDVGTQHGADYKYKYNVLLNALHDLPYYDDGQVFRPYEDTLYEEEQQELKMQQGRQALIAVWK